MDYHSPKKKRTIEIDKQLLPRLRLIGFCIMFFGVLSLGYATFSADYEMPAEDELLTPDERELNSGVFGPIKSPFLNLTPNERKKCYILSIVFVGIGTLCQLIAFKRKREIDKEHHHHHHHH